LEAGAGPNGAGRRDVGFQGKQCLLEFHDQLRSFGVIGMGDGHDNAEQRFEFPPEI